MFRQTSGQEPLFEANSLLSTAQRERLNESWAGWFRKTALPILRERESDFSVLYGSEGRPNFSVVQLLGVSLLQHLEGLSDQQALDAYSFDRRWQHALGVSLDTAHTTRRTLVEFRRRLAKADPEGELLRGVFDHVFASGLKDLELSTAHQRAIEGSGVGPFMHDRPFMHDNTSSGRNREPWGATSRSCAYSPTKSSPSLCGAIKNASF